MYAGERTHPVAAYGCLDDSVLNQPNQQVYSFCAYIETYTPARSRVDYTVTPATNVTHFSGLIAVSTSGAVTNAFGTGYPIVFAEGTMQVTTNAGLYYGGAELGLKAVSFTFVPNNSFASVASNLLYIVNDTLGNVDQKGVVFTTAAKTDILLRYLSNGGVDNSLSYIDSTGQKPIAKYSQFFVFPKEQLDSVLTQCNVPTNLDYKPDTFGCPAGSAPVSFGDVSLLDLDPYELDEQNDYQIPNFLTFRTFTANTPSTSVYQLQYLTLANPEAIVHLRLGLFSTNSSALVASYSSTPTFELLSQAPMVELVNSDDVLIQTNLPQPYPLIQGRIYAIGVWADALIYGRLSSPTNSVTHLCRPPSSPSRAFPYCLPSSLRCWWC